MPSPSPDDVGSCVVCLQDVQAIGPIWHCTRCAMALHLECMRSWLATNEAASAESARQLHLQRPTQPHGRCPGCQQTVECASDELVDKCWCGRVTWGLNGGGPAEAVEDDARSAHSCGAVCGGARPHDCPHPCARRCHRGRCAPCGFERSDVACDGGHQIFPPFPCGTTPPSCHQVCGAILPCGHACTDRCHAGPHSPCIVPVERPCACGRVAAILAPCSQTAVQCTTLCPRMRACGAHLCERRCHAGGCEQAAPVSAWGKTWGRPTPTPPPSGASTEFPSLGASTFSPAPIQPLPTPTPAATDKLAFQSCGKPCQRRRACGHPCTQLCHAHPAAPAASAASALLATASLPLHAVPSLSSSSIAASGSSACESAGCIQLSSIACACGRLSAKLRCFESRTASTITQYTCDETCRMHARGRVFFDRLRSADVETLGGVPAANMLPFPQALLAMLSPAIAASSESRFLRKLDASVHKFCVGLASGAADAPAHLYLDGLSPSRRLLVHQLALWANIFFDDEGSYLQRLGEPPVTTTALSRAASGLNLESESSEVACDEDAADVASSSSAVVVPSLSLTTAAVMYADASRGSSLVTAETWPGSLVLRVWFAEARLDDGLFHERARLLRKWLRPWRLACRFVLSTGNARCVLALFASPLSAARAFAHLHRAHSGEMATTHVTVDPPESSTSSAAQLELDTLTCEQTDLRRQASEARRAAEEEFDALQVRAAKQRASRRLAPAESVLVAAATAAAPPPVALARSHLVGHTKLQVRSRNVFNLLMEDEDDEEEDDDDE